MSGPSIIHCSNISLLDDLQQSFFRLGLGHVPLLTSLTCFTSDRYGTTPTSPRLEMTDVSPFDWWRNEKLFYKYTDTMTYKGQTMKVRHGSLSCAQSSLFCCPWDRPRGTSVSTKTAREKDGPSKHKSRQKGTKPSV